MKIWYKPEGQYFFSSRQDTWKDKDMFFCFLLNISNPLA